METTNDQGLQERRVGPTVSKEKWVNHAKTKLSRGYVLIVGKNRRNANFYLRSKGFEMCAFNVAKQLIKDGIVVESGQHPLGTMYRLADDIIPVPPPAPRKPEPEETVDEMDVLLDDLNDEPRDEPSAEATPF